MDERIIIAGLWIATMLVYLLGDVLRIYSGDYEKMKGQIKGNMWLLVAVMMVTPIVMIVATLLLTTEINRLLNIVAAIFFFIINIIGLPTYPSWYDRFLICISLIFNLMILAYALNWN